MSEIKIEFSNFSAKFSSVFKLFILLAKDEITDVYNAHNSNNNDNIPKRHLLSLDSSIYLAAGESKIDEFSQCKPYISPSARLNKFFYLIFVNFVKDFHQISDSGAINKILLTHVDADVDDVHKLHMTSLERLNKLSEIAVERKLSNLIPSMINIIKKSEIGPDDKLYESDSYVESNWFENVIKKYASKSNAYVYARSTFFGFVAAVAKMAARYVWFQNKTNYSLEMLFGQLFAANFDCILIEKYRMEVEVMEEEYRQKLLEKKKAKKDQEENEKGKEEESDSENQIKAEESEDES